MFFTYYGYYIMGHNTLQSYCKILINPISNFNSLNRSNKSLSIQQSSGITMRLRGLLHNTFYIYIWWGDKKPVLLLLSTFWSTVLFASRTSNPSFTYCLLFCHSVFSSVSFSCTTHCTITDRNATDWVSHCLFVSLFCVSFSYTTRRAQTDRAAWSS